MRGAYHFYSQFSDSLWIMSQFQNIYSPDLVKKLALSKVIPFLNTYKKKLELITFFNVMYAESSPKPKLIYFYIPLCIIFTANVTFFIITAYKIIQLKRSVRMITSQEESRRHQKKLNKKTDKWVHL